MIVLDPRVAGHGHHAARVTPLLQPTSKDKDIVMNEQTTRARLTLATIATACLFLLPVVAHANESASESVTYWAENRVSPTDVQRTEAEIKSLLHAHASEMLDQIDSIKTATGNCLASAARAGGGQDELERLTCIVTLESAKVDFLGNGQTRMSDIASELYGLAASYEADITGLSVEIDRLRETEVDLQERIEVMKQGAIVLLNTLDPENLSEDDERKMRAVLREIELSQVDYDVIVDDLSTVVAERDHAQANHSAYRGWAFEMEMAAADLDVDIARSLRQINKAENITDRAIRIEVTNGMPDALLGLRALMDNLDGLSGGPETPGIDDAETTTTDEVDRAILPSPDGNRRQLFEALQSIIEGAS